MAKKSSAKVQQCNRKCYRESLKCDRNAKGDMGCEEAYHKCAVECIHS